MDSTNKLFEEQSVERIGIDGFSSILLLSFFHQGDFKMISYFAVLLFALNAMEPLSDCDSDCDTSSFGCEIL
jgi:hypothetical protein